MNHTDTRNYENDVRVSCPSTLYVAAVRGRATGRARSDVDESSDPAGPPWSDMLLLRLVRGNGFGGVLPLLPARLSDGGGGDVDDEPSSSNDDCWLALPQPPLPLPLLPFFGGLPLLSAVCDGCAFGCSAGCTFSSSRYLLSNLRIKSILLSCWLSSFSPPPFGSSVASLTSFLSECIRVGNALRATAAVAAAADAGCDGTLAGGRLALFLTISVRFPRWICGTRFDVDAQTMDISNRGWSGGMK